VLYLVFFFFCIINFTISVFLSLVLPPPLSFLFLWYNTLFSLPTTLSAPSHPLSSLSLPPPILPQPVTTLPFPLHTHLPLPGLLYQPNTPPAPEIPDTSTLHYSSGNAPTHTRGPQNPAAPISLSLPTPLYLLPFHAIFTNYPSFYL
jgi:hypothetical protein